MDYVRTFGDDGEDNELDKWIRHIKVLDKKVNSVFPSTTSSPITQVFNTPGSVDTSGFLNVGSNDGTTTPEFASNHLLFDTTAGFTVTEDGDSAKIGFVLPANSVGPTELQSTSVTPATYGDSTHVGSFTVDADGRITSASSVNIASSGYSFDVRTVTGNFNITTSTSKIYVILINAPGVNTPAIKLPDPTSHTGIIYVRLISSNNNAAVLAQFSAEKINGTAASYSMNTSGPKFVHVVSDGTDWWVIGSEL